MIMTYVIYSLYTVITSFSVASVISLLFGVGVIIATLFARLFPLAAQDRIIRLEERMRLHDLLPQEQQGAIGQLTTEQLIGLRFASDDEVAGLIQTVVSEGIKDRKEIKIRVKNWRPDHQRV
jgi:uncharacterized membrane protein YciS (DUF1049 family)